MRFIGTFADQHDAATFVDYLLTLDVSARAERNGEQWELWILDEDRVADAKRELTDFQSNRSDEKYRVAAREAERIRRERVEQALAARRNLIHIPTSGSALMRGRRPVTMMLLFASAAVFLVGEFGKNPDAWLKLRISEWIIPTELFGFPTYALPEVRHGEIWRIFSPILIHFNIWHFVFNMYMLVEFGTLIEGRRGMWVIAGLVALAAVVGNVAQLALFGPDFGGMSGVIYGLFGYLLIKSQFEPELGFRLQTLTVVILGGWLIVCMSGRVGQVANAAHVGGLIAGLVFAAVPIGLRAIRGGS